LELRKLVLQVQGAFRSVILVGENKAGTEWPSNGSTEAADHRDASGAWENVLIQRINVMF
jgi:hypothetical protein